ncbi:MAG: M61 family metallopeptidase [Acidobacteria bacterium]|nr:M61 family metallopeptidase [Acidobacteriota bacterium]
MKSTTTAAEVQAIMMIRVFLFCLFFTVSAFGQITLSVDATDAPRNIVRVRESMPAAPGTLTLFYPKWIPGEHSPNGTLNDMVNLFVSANGKALEWRRDDVEMFAFHVDVPEGVTKIDVAFDYIYQPYTHATATLARLKWNRLVLYPRGSKSDELSVTASLKLPPNWKFATALPVDKETKDAVDFKSVNLTTFVDSPAIIGRYFTRVPLAASGAKSVPVFMDIVADNEEALKFQPRTLNGWKNLVAQAELTFGARHYDKYDFLLTLSGEGGFEGLEHHESSENGVGRDALSNSGELLDLSELLGHEYAHSWNGKYRRPLKLTTPDFEQPMHGELLWVYEGLTQYLGKVLTARSGLWNESIFRESFAELAAELDGQTGRRWRPLVDTSRAVQFTYDSPLAGRNMRRAADYYDEGALIWLEADVLIRERSAGAKSLNDFFRKFHGGESSGPKVVTYDFPEIVRTLNEILPYDWKNFFIDRVYKVNKEAPLGGITNGGWKLVYTDVPNKIATTGGSTGDHMFSIGMMVSADGQILDMNPDLAASKAGLATGMYVRTVNGQEFSLDFLRLAIAATKGTQAKIEIVAQTGEEQKAFALEYDGGERYPHLIRDPLKKDILSEIPKALGATVPPVRDVPHLSASVRRSANVKN